MRSITSAAMIEPGGSPSVVVNSTTCPVSPGCRFRMIIWNRALIPLFGIVRQCRQRFIRHVFEFFAEQRRAGRFAEPAEIMKN